MAAFRLYTPSDIYTIASGLLRIADVTIIGVAGIVAYWLRAQSLDIPPPYQAAFVIAVLLTAQIGQMLGLYQKEALTNIPAQVGRVAGTLALVLIALLVLGYFTKTSAAFSRIAVAGWFSMSVVAMLMFRVVVWLRILHSRNRGAFVHRIAIYGSGEIAHEFLRRLAINPDPDVVVVGVFDDYRTDGSVAGHPVHGGTSELLDLVRGGGADEVVLAMASDKQDRLTGLLDHLKMAPVEVRWCSESINLVMPNRGVAHIGTIPVMRVFERPLSGWSLALKSAEDRILGLVLLIVFAPIMVTVAGLIKATSRGPVFFRQRRYGFNNNEFTVLKFRTMHMMCADEAGAESAQARRNDARITLIGGLLRRTSLDELPQLFNVVAGSMSLVGPRPHAIVHNEEYGRLIDNYLARHRVKPGMTGWAQINGLRGETDSLDKMRQRVEHDLHYIENWSLIFDLRILVVTAFVGFINRNAY